MSRSCRNKAVEWSFDNRDELSRDRAVLNILAVYELNLCTRTQRVPEAKGPASLVGSAPGRWSFVGASVALVHEGIRSRVFVVPLEENVFSMRT